MKLSRGILIASTSLLLLLHARRFSLFLFLIYSVNTISQQPFSPFFLFPLSNSKSINHSRIKASLAEPEKELEGKIEIGVCTNRVCRKQGSLDTLQVLSGIAPPYVTVNSCGCLSRCGSGPSVVGLPDAVFVKHFDTGTLAAETMDWFYLGGNDVEGESRKSLEALALRKRAEDELDNDNLSEADCLLSRGSECEYRHSDVGRLNPRDCWCWLNGSCLNPKCGIRHPPLDGLLGAQVPTLTGSSVPPVASVAPTPQRKKRRRQKHSHNHK